MVDGCPMADRVLVTRGVHLSFAALIAGALVLAAVVPAPAAAATNERCSAATLIPTNANMSRIRTATLCLINVERRRRGRASLRRSRQLEKAAKRFSASMVRLGFFDHVSPQGSTLTSRVRGGTRYLSRRVRRWALGENLAWGSSYYATPKEIVRSWMQSPGHRRNILQPRFRHVGIGVVTGAPSDVDGQPAATYTADFGYKSFR